VKLVIPNRMTNHLLLGNQAIICLSNLGVFTITAISCEV